MGANIISDNMKALIRNKGETITEDMNILGIDWRTGKPLTNPFWHGGCYTLVKDYVPTVEIDEDINTEPIIVTTTNIETQNTQLTPEEIEKQKKIQALEKALETLKNS